MSQFWYTVAGRKMVEGTMPQIAHNLDRIAVALETLIKAKAQADDWPTCGWCNHRHLRPSYCQAPVGDGLCECEEVI